MSKKKRCDFRMPTAVRFDGIPYGERWAIYCACGTTIFGNSKEEAEGTWKKHVEGRLQD